MPRSASKSFAAVIAIFTVIVVALLLWRTEPKLRRLRFESTDREFSPLFVEVTRGHLETNFVTTLSGTNSPRVAYVHRHYHSRDRVESVPALRYRVQGITQRLGFRSWPSPTSMSVVPTSGDITLLWVGYRSTNTNRVLSQEALLVSEDGQRLPLTPGVSQTLTARFEHLDYWQLPCLLTNRGTYRLVLPDSGRTLLSLHYQ